MADDNIQLLVSLKITSKSEGESLVSVLIPYLPTAFVVATNVAMCFWEINQEAQAQVYKTSWFFKVIMILPGPWFLYNVNIYPLKLSFSSYPCQNISTIFLWNKMPSNVSEIIDLRNSPNFNLKDNVLTIVPISCPVCL